MHRVGFRNYFGAPGEIASVTTSVDGGGQVAKTLDGQPFPGQQFPLSPAPGGHRRLTIQLIGPEGASCVVGISTVDGGQDGDFLLCQPHAPSPVQFYDFSTAPAQALNGLAAALGRPGSKRKAARKPAKKMTARKTARKKRGGHK